MEADLAAAEGAGSAADKIGEGDGRQLLQPAQAAVHSNPWSA